MVYFTTGPQKKDLSVYEERDGTTYLINSLLVYRGTCNIYDITNLNWYLNKTEIWFKKDSEGLIGNRTELWLSGHHITILSTKPPDNIYIDYCLGDTNLCFSNVKLVKITENDSRVGYASNNNFSKEIKLSQGKKNLLVTNSAFPMLIYPGKEDILMTIAWFPPQRFTLFNGSELMVYRYVDTSGG